MIGFTYILTFKQTLKFVLFGVEFWDANSDSCMYHRFAISIIPSLITRIKLFVLGVAIHFLHCMFNGCYWIWIEPYTYVSNASRLSKLVDRMCCNVSHLLVEQWQMNGFDLIHLIVTFDPISNYGSKLFCHFSSGTKNRVRIHLFFTCFGFDDWLKAIWFDGGFELIVY